MSINAILNKVRLLQDQISQYANQEMQESKVGILKRKYIDQPNLTEKDYEQLAKDVCAIIHYNNGIPDFKPIDYEPNDKFQGLAQKLIFDATLFCKDISLITKSSIVHQSFTEQIQDLLYQINSITNLIEKPLSYLMQSRRIFPNDKSETQSMQRIDFDQQSVIGTMNQSPFCIQKQVRFSTLEMKGFTKVYDELFNKPFTQTHIELIKQRCTAQSQICIGGVSVNDPDQFILCATDYASEFYTENLRLKAGQEESQWGNILGIMVRNRSKWIQRYPDVDNEEGDQRFSLWLFHGQGGYRIGRLESLEQSVEYKCVIYLKK
ncbi:unnamed protein product (macronuclear) [Paramecium tetraurelia]|uniref:TLDc domain-containing protein n=1 Tax=Paramecium tetraurelia TaxID=5888 RepID=A0CPA0_PARTE|nr:uncharacterized protein GSPATT00009008001 [Paramecium tetraurelia]CAK72617.1 unnamed protein product [Paramecium tetraurelia]|eukprot:XP_001440014.1 hypothetical protein (macronuclear) [Paramecium tetraurelia strain d4-2]